MANKRRPSRPWSKAEHALLISLGAHTRDDQWSTLARRHFPMRTGAACKVRYNLSTRALRGVPPPAPRLREYKGDGIRAATPAPTSDPISHHQDLTAAFFGDPLPGRSALDRKRQSTLPPSSLSLRGDQHATHY